MEDWGNGSSKEILPHAESISRNREPSTITSSLRDLFDDVVALLDELGQDGEHFPLGQAGQDGDEAAHVRHAPGGVHVPHQRHQFRTRRTWSIRTEADGKRSLLSRPIHFIISVKHSTFLEVSVNQ